jgi:hypothetical protein
MGLAQFNLLGKTADEKIKYKRSAIAIRSAVVDVAVQKRKNCYRYNGMS